jgi:hypothetical protein
MTMRRTLVIAALALGIATPALAQMKEETYSGTYSGYGTSKATPIGKERFVSTWDHNGLTLTNGALDHMTWHCWGLGDFTNGAGQGHGYCVGTDSAGDQVVLDVVDDKHTLDQKNWTGSGTFTSGTGKFAGVSGSGTYMVPNDFRPGPEGTFVVYTKIQGSFKIPSAPPVATGSTTPPTATPSK